MDTTIKAVIATIITITLILAGTTAYGDYQRRELDREKLAQCEKHNAELLTLIKEKKLDQFTYYSSRCY